MTSSGNSSKVTRGRKPKLSKKQEEEILQSMLCKRIKGDPVHEKDLHDKVIFFLIFWIFSTIFLYLKVFDFLKFF